jgi:hypothetical protein
MLAIGSVVKVPTVQSPFCNNLGIAKLAVIQLINVSFLSTTIVRPIDLWD